MYSPNFPLDVDIVLNCRSIPLGDSILVGGQYPLIKIVPPVPLDEDEEPLLDDELLLDEGDELLLDEDDELLLDEGDELLLLEELEVGIATISFVRSTFYGAASRPRSSQTRNSHA
jgi:hypothetical protein